jgi:hypothetical protein
LTCQTVTTVGYGDFGLPTFEVSERTDIYITCIMIFGGSVLFSKFMASLNVIFVNKNKKMNVNRKLMSLEEQVTAFVIEYNECCN